MRVTVHGDVSAEFIFARVTDEKDPVYPINEVILGDAVAAGSKENGRDLFHVYVAQASIDSYISIAKIPPVTADGPHPMQAFDGSVTLRVFPLRGTALTKSTAGGTGSIYLGARLRAVPNVQNTGDEPVLSDNFNGRGIMPAPPLNRQGEGRLTAGMSTAPGVTLGKFMFGGAVSGRVTISGSMEAFYGGALLTGVTGGQSSEDGPDVTGNFFVGGDIRNVLVKGSIGTDGVASSLDGRVQPTYLTGVDFDIRGKAGQLRTGQDYIAWGTVFNTNKDLGLRTRQEEVEFRIDPTINRGDFTEFGNGQFGDNEGFFNNDTFATAQFVGSINNKSSGNNSVYIDGVLQSFVRVNDISDYYAVPLMAGQRIIVRLNAPSLFGRFVTINGRLVQVTTPLKSVLHVGIFDPDNRLVATDYGHGLANTDIENFDPVHQEAFAFVTEKPGFTASRSRMMRRRLATL